MQLFEIKVVPLQPTRSMVKDRFESKRENGWLNLLKTEISWHQAKIRKNYGQNRQKPPLPVIISIAKENPSIMYIQMGEETDSAYQVVFRSYTGAFVNFYVDKASGTTRMEEYVPTLDVRNEAGTIDLFDYLEKKNKK